MLSRFSYHIYKQNQTRLNNNNTTRVNLNLARPVQPPAIAQENAANVDADPDDIAESSANDSSLAESEVTVQLEPQVPFSSIVRTFVLSFFSSIIPEAPALWMRRFTLSFSLNMSVFAGIYVVSYLLIIFYMKACREVV